MTLHVLCRTETFLQCARCAYWVGVLKDLDNVTLAKGIRT